MSNKRKTTTVRIYRETNDLINSKFPGVRKADFFDIALKTNPLMRVEMALRNETVKRKKR